MSGLDGGRLNIGACSLGGAQRCLDESIKYTKDRRQFGKAIADSLVAHLKEKKVVAGPGTGLLQINGSPTDAAAGLIRQQH